MDWPQVKKAFTIKELDHIKKMNPKSDAQKLSKYLKFRDVNEFFWTLLNDFTN